MAGALPHQKFAPLADWTIASTLVNQMFQRVWNILIDEIRTATNDGLKYIDTRPSTVSESYWEKGICIPFFVFLKKKKNQHVTMGTFNSGMSIYLCSCWARRTERESPRRGIAMYVLEYI